jgi:hypothetical protein
MILLHLLHQNLQVTQFDVQGAFVHAPLTEEVFIKTPKGVNRDAPYLKLKKSLYGLKQAPKNWYEKSELMAGIYRVSRIELQPMSLSLQQQCLKNFLPRQRFSFSWPQQSIQGEV